jgi:hypothetical protein
MEGKESQVAKTLTVEAAEKELGISRSSAYEAARRGEIPAIVIDAAFSFCGAASTICWEAT